MFDADGFCISVFMDNDRTAYVNYAYSYVNSQNAFATSSDISNGELRSNTYLKLLSGASGILWSDASGAGQKAYIRNFSNAERQRIAITKI